MKALVAAAALIVMGMATNALAQDDTGTIEVARAVVEAERKLIVAKNLKLTNAEGEAFWPVYNEYREAMRKVNDRRAKVILALAEEIGELSDDRAKEMLDEVLKFQQERVKVRRSHLKGFYKVLPTKKAVRYYQMESKLDVIADFAIARAIPLVP